MEMRHFRDLCVDGKKYVHENESQRNRICLGTWFRTGSGKCQVASFYEPSNFLNDRLKDFSPGITLVTSSPLI
jgi:hypothetical protein